MSIMELVIVIDESGEKGNSYRKETQTRDFGLMAAYCLPAHGLEYVNSTLERKFSHLFQRGVKPHLADLSPQEREQYRADALEFLESHKISWSYTAIHVNGFHDQMSKRRGKKNLHEALFGMLITKIVALAYSKNTDVPIKLKIISDNLNSGEIVKFKNELVSYLDFLKTGTMTFLHPVRSKEPSLRRVDKLVATTPEELHTNWDVSFSISTEVSPLTFVADVLSHTTYKLLKANIEKSEVPPDKLNHERLIDNHPLKEYAVCLSTDGLELSEDSFYSYKSL
ncbi:hypothetical protein [Vibrio coralliirubri]|uniref:hypothetical protein n=1 Tax=Vibrio coralliirubri TaxID=1516159 RepID=UPI00065E2E2B|nr:hypothetical protein [Vibrio coralliirubri]